MSLRQKQRKEKMCIRDRPYTMVKDHRTNEESGNVASVLDGNIDPFINAYLKWNSLQKSQPDIG